MSLYAVILQFPNTRTKRTKHVPILCACAEGNVHEDVIWKGWYGKSQKYKALASTPLHTSSFKSGMNLNADCTLGFNLEWDVQKTHICVLIGCPNTFGHVM